MEKRNKQFGAFLIAGFLLLLAVAVFYTVHNPSHISSVHPTPTIISDAPVSKNISIKYKGHAGQDALSLLKKDNEVEMGSSGLVVSINGRKAQDKKHEYWAFYVNDKMAQVGPADYKTKDSDHIEWKIEKY